MNGWGGLAASQWEWASSGGGDRLTEQGCLCSGSSLAEAPAVATRCSDKRLQGSEIGFREDLKERKVKSWYISNYFCYVFLLAGSGSQLCDFRTGPYSRSRSSRQSHVFFGWSLFTPPPAERSSGRHKGKDAGSGRALGVSFLNLPTLSRCLRLGLWPEVSSCLKFGPIQED